ncbi:MAG: hypothetical protein HC849_17135, partial [Oscillatoriales cyanobacterium RU_3_3]|nr:hypothetical protein [Oscillatoriales cyanobacterium RU_3_3]
MSTAVLVAVFTASTTFGLSNSANGQTSYSEATEDSLAAVPPVESIAPPDLPQGELAPNPPQNRVEIKASKKDAIGEIATKAPARGENDRDRPDRLPIGPAPGLPPALNPKTDLEPQPSPASNVKNAPPDADRTPLPATTVSPSQDAVEPGKQDAAKEDQNSQIQPAQAQQAPIAPVRPAPVPPRPPSAA